MKELKMEMESLLEDKIEDIIEDLEANVVRNRGLRELMIAINFVYYSPLAFYFQGSLISKGVAELIVVGDTRTGKSSTTKALMKHYRLGDFINGDAISAAGLLAGIDDSNGQRFVRAGRLPLNDRKLLIIDEANEMDKEIVGQMSGVRSSGILDIVKINSCKLPCRVRQIWLANTRGRKTVAEHTHGCLTLAEVCGKPEDIARFDLGFTLSGSDIDVHEANSNKSWANNVEQKYSSDLCNSLVRWAWSRKPEQIIISKDSEKAILEHSLMLCSEYHNSIPLVTPTEVRLQVARLSISLAAQVLSTDESFTKCLVHPYHVAVTYQLMRRIFNSKSMGYGAWSSGKMHRSSGGGALRKGIDVVFSALGSRGCQALINLDAVTKSDFSKIFNNNDAGGQCYQIIMLCDGFAEGEDRRGRKSLSANFLSKAKNYINLMHANKEESYPNIARLKESTDDVEIPSSTLDF